MGAHVNLYLFSDSQSTFKKLSQTRKTKALTLTVLPFSDLDKQFKKNGFADAVYVDLSKKNDAAVKKALTALSKQKDIICGVIDPEGRITDPATLFHDGFADYLGKNTLAQGLDAKRLNRVLTFARRNLPQAEEPEEQAAALSDIISSGKGWKYVKPGTEYTFCFMFVELDLTYEWKNKSGKIHLSKVSADFLKFIQKSVEPYQGNVWLWGEFGGIILFPFDGTSVDAIQLCYKLILNRTIISVEDFRYSTPVSIRMALDIGNTVYQKRGETGGIVSDTINFMFHLGKKFLPPGNFYLTDRSRRYIPKGMGGCFQKAGVFENVEIYRMRLPAN